MKRLNKKEEENEAPSMGIGTVDEREASSVFEYEPTATYTQATHDDLSTSPVRAVPPLPVTTTTIAINNNNNNNNIAMTIANATTTTTTKKKEKNWNLNSGLNAKDQSRQNGYGTTANTIIVTTDDDNNNNARPSDIISTDEPFDITSNQMQSKNFNAIFPKTKRIILISYLWILIFFIIAASVLSIIIFTKENLENVPDSYQTLRSIVLPMLVLFLDLISLFIINSFISSLRDWRSFAMYQMLQRYKRGHLIFLLIIYILPLGFYSYYVSLWLHQQINTEEKLDDYLWLKNIPDNKWIRIIFLLIYPIITNFYVLCYTSITMIVVVWPERCARLFSPSVRSSHSLSESQSSSRSQSLSQRKKPIKNILIQPQHPNYDDQNIMTHRKSSELAITPLLQNNNNNNNNISRKSRNDTVETMASDSTTDTKDDNWVPSTKEITIKIQPSRRDEERQPLISKIGTRKKDDESVRRHTTPNGDSDDEHKSLEHNWTIGSSNAADYTLLKNSDTTPMRKLERGSLPNESHALGGTQPAIFSSDNKNENSKISQPIGVLKNFQKRVSEEMSLGSSQSRSRRRSESDLSLKEKRDLYTVGSSNIDYYSKGETATEMCHPVLKEIEKRKTSNSKHHKKRSKPSLFEAMYRRFSSKGSAKEKYKEDEYTHMANGSSSSKRISSEKYNQLLNKYKCQHSELSSTYVMLENIRNDLNIRQEQERLLREQCNNLKALKEFYENETLKKDEQLGRKDILVNVLEEEKEQLIRRNEDLQNRINMQFSSGSHNVDI